MKTIKIIDLLSKIANGEEVPNMVLPKWFTTNMYLHYDNETKDYYNEEDTYELFGKISLFLNDEVEITEDKKIEKFSNDCFADDLNKNEEFLVQNINQLKDKVNEIIDVINEMKENK